MWVIWGEPGLRAILNLAEAASALSSGFLMGVHSHWHLAAALLVLLSVLAALRRFASRRSRPDRSPRGDLDADRRIEIAIFFDAAAFDAAVVTLTSVLHRSDPARPYTVHAFFREIGRERLEKLTELQRSHFRIVSHRLEACDEAAGPTHWPTSIAYARLRLPELLPQTSRVLYLDVDLVALRDVADLFDCPLGGAPIAACPDLNIAWRREAGRPPAAVAQTTSLEQYFTEVLGLAPELHARYFNSGVLLMDLDRLRGMDFLAKAERLIEAKAPRLIWGDQCVLNALVADSAQMLDPAWNATAPGNLRVFLGRGHVTREWRHSLRRAAIIHFTGGKPWRLHPRMGASAWWRFALASPAAGEILRSAWQSLGERRAVVGALVNALQIAAGLAGAWSIRRDLAGVSGGLRRPVAWWAKPSLRVARREMSALFHAARDPRTPWYARTIAVIVAGYAMSPIDLVPDFTPIVGRLDDLLIVPLGLVLVRCLIPAALIAEHRARIDERWR
jgi:lipopolysaccharide biosynthesis glycosyltransferase/uncharacterized membrane protein YkvA (DUF1232 family)